MNRREFLSMTVATAAMSALDSRPAFAQDAKYKACVIGDAKNGGYGHNMHMLFMMRDDVEIVGLSEPIKKAREYYQKQCGALRTYPGYAEMLSTEKPDLVAIGPRWTTNHKEYLLACAEAGAHGIMEKPLTADLAEADEIIAAIDAKNLKWAAALNFRASPMIRKVKKLVFEEGLIGEVLEIRSRGKEDQRAGGEDLIVLGIHTLDMMNYFLGKVASCDATVLVDGRPAVASDVKEASEPLGPIVGDAIHAKYIYENGIPAYFSTVQNPDGNQNRWGMEIHGTKGILSIRMNPVPDVYHLADASWAPGRKGTDWQRIEPPDSDPSRHEHVGHYAPIVDDLIQSIEQDHQPFTSLHAIRDAHEMIQAVWQAAVTRERVDFPLVEREHPLRNWT
ncbi:MAG: Gfo/Idh/MocA family oxidoreductase [Candidatus Hydrogenedentota bacterium]